MKKTILLFSLFAIFACSSDSSDAVGSEAPESLDGASLSPQTSNLIGYGQTVNYILTKDNVILDNVDYTWTISDTLKGFIFEDGQCSSRMIGQTNIIVKDSQGNSLTANVATNPKINDIPDMPYIKWGATNAQIKDNIVNSNSGWTLYRDQYPYLNPIFKKGNHAMRYYISASTGLFRAEFIYDYHDITDSGGVSDVNKLKDYNNERFVEMKMDDPHYYGFKRWWYKGADNKKVYIDIQPNANQTYFMLRYAEN